ncbi:unnamed protein product [Alopecurus aequalis]
MHKYIERSTHLLYPGKHITFSDFSLKLFNDIIGQTAFGVDFGLTKDDHQEAGDFIKKHLYAVASLKMDLSGSLSMILGTVMPMLQEPLRELLLRVPGSVDRRMDETNAALSSKLDGIIAERAAREDRGHKDFLSVLLNAIDGTGVLGKDLKLFPEPNMFRPERFDPESEECKRRHPYAYSPFGIGPRACPGAKFAMQNLKLAVIHLYHRYIFRHSLSMESPLQFQFAIWNNFKNGVKVQVIERKNRNVCCAT